jgi:hypothetical protein
MYINHYQRLKNSFKGLAEGVAFNWWLRTVLAFPLLSAIHDTSCPQN